MATAGPGRHVAAAQTHWDRVHHFAIPSLHPCMATHKYTHFTYMRTHTLTLSIQMTHSVSHRNSFLHCGFKSYEVMLLDNGSIGFLCSATQWWCRSAISDFVVQFVSHLSVPLIYLISSHISQWVSKSAGYLITQINHRCCSRGAVEKIKVIKRHISGWKRGSIHEAENILNQETRFKSFWCQCRSDGFIMSCLLCPPPPCLHVAEIDPLLWMHQIQTVSSCVLCTVC